jgi:hypothetical protein
MQKFLLSVLLFLLFVPNVVAREGMSGIPIEDGSLTRPSPRELVKKKANDLPPHWKQWIRTCRAEQPATLPGYKGNKWKGIAWEQTTNYTYLGGCGATQANWDQHKRPGQPKYMNNASPVEQLWFCERIYKFYLRQSGSHRYAATVWDANRNILGWYGFTEETW